MSEKSVLLVNSDPEKFNWCRENQIRFDRDIARKMVDSMLKSVSGLPSYQAKAIFQSAIDILSESERNAIVTLRT